MFSEGERLAKTIQEELIANGVVVIGTWSTFGDPHIRAYTSAAKRFLEEARPKSKWDRYVEEVEKISKMKLSDSIKDAMIQAAARYWVTGV